MQRVDGKAIAKQMVEEMRELAGTPKRVCFVISSEESRSYIKIKSRMALELGIEATTKQFGESVVEEIAKENFDGVVIQLPLPDGVNAEKVFDALPFAQDIDMLGREAREKFAQGETERMPPVAAAVDEILKRYLVDLSGKKILILGRGRLVGEPVAQMFEQKNTPFESVSKESPEEEILAHLKTADVVISGMGSPHFIKPEMLKPGVVLIDLGTSEEGGKLLGDADPECEAVASIFTPVPGGAGPITVACLFRNLFS